MTLSNLYKLIEALVGRETIIKLAVCIVVTAVFNKIVQKHINSDDLLLMCLAILFNHLFYVYAFFSGYDLIYLLLIITSLAASIIVARYKATKKLHYAVFWSISIFIFAAYMITKNPILLLPLIPCPFVFCICLVVAIAKKLKKFEGVKE